MATFANWANNAMIGLFFPYMMSTLKDTAFAIFVGTCIAMSTFTYFYLPETRGIALEDMNDLFDQSAIGTKGNVHVNSIESK